MDLKATRDKVDEAKFFLSYLTEEQDKPGSPTFAPFRYFLSAFLNAAYGVQQYLKAEFIRQTGAQGKKLTKTELSNRYVRHFKKWLSNLAPEERALWDSMIEKRGSETHHERVKTVTKPKAVAVNLATRFPYDTGRSFALVAHYYAMQHHVAAWDYVQEHHLEIGSELHATVKACEDYVALLDGLVTHFEQSAP